MAKFYGNIGYMQTVEEEPGIWVEDIVEREYYGDYMRNSSSFQQSGQVNDNISMSNSISIVADPYAHENFQHMRYVVINDQKWKITNIEVQYPRLILTVGGVYNVNENED